MKEHDFHITLGFRYRDVFGVRKNEIIKKEGKFLKLLSQEFNKSDSWNFIRRITNFNLDDEIIPVKIDNSKIKIRCQSYYMDIIWLEEEEKFWVATKYPFKKEEELPRLSETEISKILKKN